MQVANSTNMRFNSPTITFINVTGEDIGIPVLEISALHAGFFAGSFYASGAAKHLITLRCDMDSACVLSADGSGDNDG